LMKQPPSIFNDVIGPVMMGPSSSHTAGPARIGKLARQLLRGGLRQAVVEFAATGSYALVYQGQGTDRGFTGGLLGWGPEDERLSRSLEEAAKQGIQVEFRVEDFAADHPNTARIRLKSDEDQVHLTALSVGGGMIEIVEINGFPVSISGDFFEVLFFLDKDHGAKAEAEALAAHLYSLGLKVEGQDVATLPGRSLVSLKLREELSAAALREAAKRTGAKEALQLSPVLPVLSCKDCAVPFQTAAEMLSFAQKEGLELWEVAARYEMARSGWSEAQVLAKMGEIIGFMESSVRDGLKNTTRPGKILKPQSGIVQRAAAEGKLLPIGALHTVTAWSMAVLEVNSYLGVVVAAPTAGSCGVLPGAILGMAAEMKATEEDKVKAMLAAGGIGLLIAKQATFAAEVCGCQAECGAASAMAAAGIVQLAGGSARQGVGAASMALQNLLGMICDPVAELVEVPCLGKNVVAAVNAVAAANMLLAGVDAIIPLDEVIISMYEVGSLLPRELRCTGLGGLAVTPTGKSLKAGIGCPRAR
jgi:L-serine dehydratase